MNQIEKLKAQVVSLSMVYRNKYAEFPKHVLLGTYEKNLVDQYKLSLLKPSEIATDLEPAKKFLGFSIVHVDEPEYLAVANQLISEDEYNNLSKMESEGESLFEDSQLQFLSMPLVMIPTAKGNLYGIVLHNTERNPTLDAYSEINEAIEHFNKELFDGQLPKCLVTFQREKSTMGYFSPKRFANKSGDKLDELALNPSYFGVLPLQVIMQTIVHELCHEWQFHFGKPSRGGYHNREWADKMIEVGLMPSDTGVKGGKEVGQKMGDYCISGGRFELACQQLFNTEFALSWYDRFAPITKEQALLHSESVSISSDKALAKVKIESGLITFKPSANLEHYEDDENGEKPEPIKPKNKSNRAKYQCPTCKTNMWGAPDKLIFCGEKDCEKVAFEEVE